MAASAKSLGARVLGEVEVVNLEEVCHFEGVFLNSASLKSKTLL